MTGVPETNMRPERRTESLEDANLLVSILWWAPGRARREIVGRLRALGDASPLVTPTGRWGLMVVRTSLDVRIVVRALREVAATTPEVFRTTCKWVPVDLWTRGDFEAMRQGVSRVQVGIGPTERWRMTLEKRAQVTMPTPALIAALAELVHAPVDLTNPEKILMIQLFPDRAALSVLSPSDVFSIVPVPWLRLARGRAAPVRGARAAGVEPLSPDLPRGRESHANRTVATEEGPDAAPVP